MISYRHADLLRHMREPKPIYFAFDDNANQQRMYDPITKQHSNNPTPSDEPNSGETDENNNDISWSPFLEGEVPVKIGSDYYVVDAPDHKGEKTFILNDYVGEYDHIDPQGNFVFEDNRFGKFAKSIFSVKDWVLTSNHERGMHLERRHTQR